MGEQTWAKAERAAMASELERLGPDQPTLCGEWTTRDLAAHIIVRESRPDASLGIAIKPLAGHLDRVQKSEAKKPWPELLRLLRTGPPTFSTFNVPGMDALLNTTEFFVHLEDVRRAQPDWEPRELNPKFSDSLWKIVRGRAIAFYRNVPVGIVLHRTDGNNQPIRASIGSQTVTISGPAQELLFYSFGRKQHSLVSIDGPAGALEALAEADMSV